MKYTEIIALCKQARKSWDPDYESWDENSEFSLDPAKTEKIDNTIHDQLVKHYAKLLSKAYKESTGKTLKDPWKKIQPRFGYVIGRAANVHPDVLEKLNDYYFQRLGGWSTTSYNVEPGLAMDAVDIANSKEFMPYDYVTNPNVDPNSTYTAETKIKAKY